MLRKAFRGLFTLIGAAFGYIVVELIASAISNSGTDVTELFTASQRTGITIVFAIIFAIIFFKIEPAIGKQSGKIAENISKDIAGVSGLQITAGTMGLIAGLFIAFLLSQMFAFIDNQYVYSGIVILLYLGFGFLGVVVATTKRGELLPSVPLKRPEASGRERGRKKNESSPKILDTSVIIDGRIADIMSTGFLEGPIVIPEFVLVELRHIADSSDSLKRTRGRRGLDILKKIQTEYGVEIYNTENEKVLKDIPEVDVKLLKLAQIMNGKVVTNDYNLNKVAGINGVDVLNINKLANCLKPVVLPGEEMTVKLVKQGKDPSQAIGYLDDGTMIVAEDGRRMIGSTTKITVTSVLQTSAGRMIFGRLKNA
ncbi:MAG: PIN domain-containing protein [Eubacterium sp.]|nr:PIN domain-containing protein [Eubacterium sp.]